MCDFSHRQAVIFDWFPFRGEPCEKSHMVNGREIDSIKRALQSAMEERGIKARPLSIASGLGETGIRDFFASGKDIKVGTLKKIAEVLDWPLDDFLGFDPVPLAGRIGAGGTILYDDVDTEEKFVRRPPGQTGVIMALEVIGDSMLPKYEAGDIIYVRRDHDGLLPKYLNRYCAVHVRDGGTFLKILTAGTQASRYTLRSLNAADIENMEVEWASPVLFVMPRSVAY
jgi:hypothetical protein